MANLEYYKDQAAQVVDATTGHVFQPGWTTSEVQVWNDHATARLYVKFGATSGTDYAVSTNLNLKPGEALGVKFQSAYIALKSESGNATYRIWAKD